MVVTKQQVVQKALDNYIEAQERGLEVAQKALAMHQRMRRAEVQEGGPPWIDEEERTVSDEVQDGQREVEAIRQRLEEARDARLNGPRASEDFLNEWKGDTWADQTALDDFGVRPPEDSGLGPIEDYEPGRPTGDDVSELPVTEPAEPLPMPSASAGTPGTLRTGKKEPGPDAGSGTLKGRPSPAPPSEPSTVGPSPGPAGGAEPAEGPGLLSRFGGWLADTAFGKVVRAGWEWVEDKVSSVIGVALGAALVIGCGVLLWTFWPTGGSEPTPPNPPVVQAPAPAPPEPAPPNPFEPVPQDVPPNPFGGPEPVPPNPFEPQAPPPNPFEPPHAPQGVPPNPFEPDGSEGPAVPPAEPAPANPFEPGQHGSNPGGDTGSSDTGGGSSGTDTGGTGGSDTGGHSGSTDSGGTGDTGDTGDSSGTGSSDSGGTGGTGGGSDTGGGNTGGHSGGTGTDDTGSTGSSDSGNTGG
ncbi:hypothetical protein SAMN02982929_05254 [Saccharopolyspora kobensis]|uniref:Uncharacterized protein n=1 Tax=Saccharopolyspora kobensis TaxID=146035 RepID=A0A1H6DYY3_9PSEU|nr:hypothetical protein [Saccharopolyspora kobensis]SEG90548.1 hypothetical protein SAMN02982929_05254 [Saccharopolyspora kobensis]SFD92025.1 hypothetical protein SAMN05216506_107229 [Saccharopolyspora kobensis]